MAGSKLREGVKALGTKTWQGQFFFFSFAKEKLEIFQSTTLALIYSLVIGEDSWGRIGGANAWGECVGRVRGANAWGEWVGRIRGD